MIGRDVVNLPGILYGQDRIVAPSPSRPLSQVRFGVTQRAHDHSPQ